MTAVTLTPENISADWDRGSVVIDYPTNVEVEIGDAVYLDSNNELNLAIATSQAAARAIGIVVGVPNQYAETTAPAGSWASVCVFGPVYGFTGLVSGNPLYVSKTVAGGLDTAAPTTAYDWAVGNAVAADTFYVHPGQTSPVSA